VRLGASFHLAYGSSGTVLLSDLRREEVDRILAVAPQPCWERQKPADVFKRLKELREKGTCIDLGLFSPSCHAISAPLCVGCEGVVAAMTIIGFPHELPRQRVPTLTKLLLEGTRQAEKELRKLRADRSAANATSGGRRVLKRPAILGSAARLQGDRLGSDAS
jgi:DNA-binding IclR family transcriptional regulator